MFDNVLKNLESHVQQKVFHSCLHTNVEGNEIVFPLKMSVMLLVCFFVTLIQIRYMYQS